MTNVDELRAALLAIPDSLVGCGLSRVADTWSQAAASFASLTVESNNPTKGDIQQLLGETSTMAMMLLERASILHMMINDFVATL